MIYIEIEIQILKAEIIEMWRLVASQMKSSMIALTKMDKDSANEIILNEKKVNSLELRIDRICENIFALHNPVANDLRLVLALLKINSNLERIGDVAASIAKFIKKTDDYDYSELIKETHILEMFEEAVDLLEDVLKSFETEDSLLATTIFKRDRALNTYNKSARAFIINKIKEDPQRVEECLSILSITRKLERAGDQSKSIAEEIIFFIDAKVLRHGQKIQNPNTKL